MLYLDRTRTSYRSLSGRFIDCWERWTIPKYEAKLLSSIGSGLCCSTVDQAVFQKMHPQYSIAMIPNSVDSDHFIPRKREVSEPRLVFTGTFSYFPNLDSLYFFVDEIWPTLRQRFPNLELDIIGARPPQKILDLAQSPGLRVLPDVPDMAEHLFEHDLFICPLRVASGMRNKVLEAMSAGMTVISTTIGVEGMSLEPGKHYLQADTVQEFIGQIETALRSFDLRQKIGTFSRQFVQSYHSGEAAPPPRNHYFNYMNRLSKIFIQIRVLQGIQKKLDNSAQIDLTVSSYGDTLPHNICNVSLLYWSHPVSNSRSCRVGGGRLALCPCLLIAVFFCLILYLSIEG